jgi:hypothetical protein
MARTPSACRPSRSGNAKPRLGIVLLNRGLKTEQISNTPPAYPAVAQIPTKLQLHTLCHDRGEKCLLLTVVAFTLRIVLP